MTLAETLAAATLAWLVAVTPRIVSRNWRPMHMVAAAAILYPALDAFVSFVQVAELIGQPTVLQPLSTEALERIPVRLARRNLTVPLAGIALVALAGAAVPALAYGRRVAKGHMGPFVRDPRAWSREAHLGLAVAALVIVAEAVALLLVAGPLALLQTGDESARFSNATWLHVLALSLVPAVVEEAYYRGLLQGLLDRALPARGLPWTAIVVQALLFGLAHAGFLTVSHILGPFLFALGMGYVRSVVGLGATMVAHFAVNLFFFSVDPGAGSTVLLVAAALVALAGLVVLIKEARTLWGLVRQGPDRVVHPAR